MSLPKRRLAKKIINIKITMNENDLNNYEIRRGVLRISHFTDL